MKRLSVVIVVGALVLGGAQAASARTRILALGSVSMDVPPTATISGWTLNATGANTRSGGSVQITANVAYTLTVVADRARFTEYDTGSSAYVSGGKTIASALTVSAARTSGTGTGLSASAGTSAATIATGLGLGTDVFAITLSQTTAISDGALGTGRTYRIVLTYTAASTL